MVSRLLYDVLWGFLTLIPVKTLAIRGTAEENMVTRRNTLKDRQEKLPKLIEESGMRHFIAVRIPPDLCTGPMIFK